MFLNSPLFAPDISLDDVGHYSQDQGSTATLLLGLAFAPNPELFALAEIPRWLIFRGHVMDGSGIIPESLSRLTPREVQVLILIAEGKTSKEVATTLSI